MEENSKQTKKEVEVTQEEKIKKIEEERNNQKQLPKEIKEKVSKNIFYNLLIGLAISLYLIFINLGFVNINQLSFITDLQVFSLVLMLTTIVIFEKAYKRDSGKITIYGLEVLALSIITMVLPRVYNEHKKLFIDIVGSITLAYIVYYISKCIIIYAKTKRKVRKRNMQKITQK